MVEKAEGTLTVKKTGTILVENIRVKYLVCSAPWYGSHTRILCDDAPAEVIICS